MFMSTSVKGIKMVQIIGKIDMPVLGLAGRHFQNMKLQKMGSKKQVRRADQALYPIQSGSFVVRGP